MNFSVTEVSSLAKVRTVDDVVSSCMEKKYILGGESFSYQIVLDSDVRANLAVGVSSPLKDFIKLYSVDDVVMDLPKFPNADDDYITFEPGKMPDLLTPLENMNNRIIVNNAPRSIWVKVDIPKDYPAGKYPIEIAFDGLMSETDVEKFSVSQKTTVEVLGINLPEQKLIFTQWFHVDCIASAHNVGIYSEEHWELIEKYVKMAADVGINMILTPVITPPLDTAVGKMRHCTQLAKIKKDGDIYSFDFSLLKRWLEMCKRNGIKYYEISHLFSQWGLEYAPNIIVEENGEKVHMFGWHIKGNSELYKNFIVQFIPSLVAFLKQEGIIEQCYFHLSDEPSIDHLENYRYAYELVVPLLGGAKTIEAISDIDFYEHGLISTPVPSNDHIEEFLDKQVENLWTYYCCGQGYKVGNRFLSMPSYRNRILGVQLYKYNIQGFLQWGYNFYYSQHSMYEINPYTTTSASFTYPSGDAFSVYPGKNEPLPSFRAIIFKEALQEIELCRLLEQFVGKDKVVEFIEKEAGMEITFSEYPRNSEFLPSLNRKIKEELKKYI